MSRRNRFVPHAFIIALLLFAQTGCSRITVTHHVIGARPPLCKTSAHGDKVVVYWGAAWRADQKEVATREAIAEQGIKDFFRSTDCLNTLSISKTVAGRDALRATDTEAVSDAKAAGADKVILIRVEELGPNLIFYLSPILWETRNEVLLRIRIINTSTEQLETDLSTHWFRGGPFTVIGAKSLPTDFAGALKAIF